MEKDKKFVTCHTCEEKIAKSAKICPHCGAKNKARNFIGWWWKIPLIVLFLPIIFSATEGGLPSCDSEQGKSDAIQAFNNGPFMKQVGYKLLSIKNVTETSYDETKGIRKCTGTGFSNGGKIKIRYKFEDGDDGQYWVEVKEI